MSYTIDGKTYCKHGHERTKKTANKYDACRVCHNQKFNTPGKVRRQNYRRYGLTEQEVQAMFESQRGLCAACGNPETSTIKRTGEIKMLHRQIKRLVCSFHAHRGWGCCHPCV